MPKPGDAREDWQIIAALAEVVGKRLPYANLPGVRQRLADVAAPPGACRRARGAHLAQRRVLQGGSSVPLMVCHACLLSGKPRAGACVAEQLARCLVTALSQRLLGPVGLGSWFGLSARTSSSIGYQQRCAVFMHCMLAAAGCVAACCAVRSIRSGARTEWLGTPVNMWP